MIVKCDLSFNIKGRGKVFVAHVADNPGVDVHNLVGMEIRVEPIHDPDPPLDCVGKTFHVTACEFFSKGMGCCGSSVGLVVREVRNG
jgi:hypothetical protein